MPKRNGYTQNQLQAIFNRFTNDGIAKANGYGLVYRVFLQTDLSDYAKLLLIYLDSFDPKKQDELTIKNILKDLNIGKATYYLARKELVSKGFLSVGKRIFQLKSAEIGTQCTYKIQYSSDNSLIKDVVHNSDRIKRQLKEKNTTDIKKIQFGTMPRAVLLNNNLSKNAKLLYAYLATFSPAIPTDPKEAEKIDFIAITKPAATKHAMNFSDKRYSRAMRELIAWNFIERVKIQGNQVTYRLVYNPMLDKALQIQNDMKEKTSILSSIKKAAKSFLSGDVAQSNRQTQLKMLEDYYYEIFENAESSFMLNTSKSTEWISDDPKQTLKRTAELAFKERIDASESQITAELEYCFDKVVRRKETISAFPSFFISGLRKIIERDKAIAIESENLPKVSLYNWLERRDY